VEVGGGGEEKRAMLAVPAEALDGNRGVIDLNDIEGVESPRARAGGGGTAVDDERGMAGDFVTRGAFAGTADMQMAGEDEIHAAARRTGHGHVRSSDQTVKLAGSGQTSLPLCIAQGKVSTDKRSCYRTSLTGIAPKSDVFKNSLTGPTLLEMSDYATYVCHEHERRKR
jgi:hypothetical protein